MNDHDILKEDALITIAFFRGPNAWPKQSLTWSTRA